MEKTECDGDQNRRCDRRSDWIGQRSIGIKGEDAGAFDLVDRRIERFPLTVDIYYFFSGPGADDKGSSRLY
jgi:hypothetical protein